jgi:hypothetical protein
MDTALDVMKARHGEKDWFWLAIRVVVQSLRCWRHAAKTSSV